MQTNLWSENLKGIDHLEFIGIGGRVILKFILSRVGGCGLDSGFINGGEFRNQLRDYELLKKSSVPWN